MIERMTVNVIDERGSSMSSADRIEIQTPSGKFNFGVDNDGCVYVSTNAGILMVSPQASNRVRLEEKK